MRYSKLLFTTLFIILGFSVQNFAQPNNSSSANQFEGLDFDKKEAFIICPFVPMSFNYENPIVGVTVKVFGQSQNLKYKYSVSGGRIIGTSAKVNWDLNKMPPGLYKLTVNVRGKMFWRTFVKEIRLNPPSACDPPCSCPNLSIISSPQNIEEGKTAIFTAQTRGGSQTLITYKWTLSEGKITKGQRTPRIKVRTKGLTGKTITATVEVGGDLCAECSRTAEASVKIE